MYVLSNQHKTTRFWLRIIYSLACFAMAATTLLMNYTGCENITDIRRGIGATTIIIWLPILRNIFNHHVFELALIHRPDTQISREAPHNMNYIHQWNLIYLSLLFIYNFPIMIYYKLYDPNIPQECTDSRGYYTLLALLVLNSVPIGVNLVLVLVTFIGGLFTLFIRWIGFWFKTYTLNFTNQLQAYFGAYGINKHTSQPTYNNNTSATTGSTTSNQVVLDIELSDSSKPSLTTQITTQQPIKECPVCLENKMIYLKMVCGHKLCLQCANTWFNENQSCPVCRNQISQTPDNLAEQQQSVPAESQA